MSSRPGWRARMLTVLCKQTDTKSTINLLIIPLEDWLIGLQLQRDSFSTFRFMVWSVSFRIPNSFFNLFVSKQFNCYLNYFKKRGEGWKDLKSHGSCYWKLRIVRVKNISALLLLLSATNRSKHSPIMDLRDFFRKILRYITKLDVFTILKHSWSYKWFSSSSMYIGISNESFSMLCKAITSLPSSNDDP